MTELQTIKSRLLAFLSYKNLKKSHFEKKVGLCNGYVNGIVKTISPEKLEAISKNYPDLNPGWLMTGEGSMLRVKTYETAEEAKAAEGSVVYGGEDYKKKYEEAQKNLDALRELYAKEQEQNKLKDITIATLQKLVDLIDKTHSEGGANRGDV